MTGDRSQLESWIVPVAPVEPWSKLKSNFGFNDFDGRLLVRGPSFG
jgi:hypothetical protein